MKNLKFNKGNIKKFVICVGLGGVITFGSIYGLRMNKDKTIGEIVNDVKSNVLSLVDDNSSNKITNELTSEEFLEEFDNIYKNSETLQSEWSNIYPELKDFISTYGEYLDQKQILEALPNLKFSHNGRFSDDGVLAEYNYSENTIEFSQSLKHKTPGEIKKTVLHESFHFLFQQGFLESNKKYKDIGWILDEGLVSMLNQEYGVYEGKDNFKKASNYIRALCEVIGTDKFMEYAGSHDLEGLIKELGRYSSEKEAKQLIENINMAGQYHRTKGTQYDKSAWSTIDKMYQKKNGTSVKDSNDQLMKIYSNETLDTSYSIDGVKYVTSAEANKHYFVKDGKNSIIDKDTQEEIQLDENNEILKSRKK